MSSPEHTNPLRALARWETVLLLALVAALLYGANTRNFWTTTNAFFVGLNIGEVAIMALPLTLIVITGEIDLSIASMLGLAGTLLGYLTLHGWSILPAMLVVLLVGCVGGSLNGFLVTTVGLPSIAVTIGTLTLYRGLAEGLLKAQSVGGYSLWLTKIGVQPIPHTHLAWSVGLFLVLAIAFGVVLHATPVGRSIYAIGLQAETAKFSGIRVRRIKFQLYVLSGLVSAFAGILWTFRFASSRYDAGTGLELTVVAIVLFGGVSIFGGRGSIIGVVLSAAIIACLQQAMTLRKIDPQVRNIVTGVLLLLSVVVPNLGEVAGRVRGRWRHRPELGAATTPARGVAVAAVAGPLSVSSLSPPPTTPTTAPTSSSTPTTASKG